ncbi:MAG: histidine phosphatase family protein [Pseudomonadota bacterium]
MNQTIYLIRHGETEWNVEGRFQGRTHSDLTEKGRAQAADVGAILLAELGDGGGFDFQVSPQRRTRDTARIALSALDIEPRPNDKLMELDVGEWSGLLFEDVLATHPELVSKAKGHEWIYEAPGGERLHDMRARAESWLAEVSGPTVAIGHGAIGRQIRGAYLGIPALESLRLPETQGGVLLLKDGEERLITREGLGASASQQRAV